MKLRRWITLLLVLTMLMSLFPTAAFAVETQPQQEAAEAAAEAPSAEDGAGESTLGETEGEGAGDDAVPEEQGTIGDTIEYTLWSDSTLTVSGEGEIPDYTWEEPAPWAQWADRVVSVELGTGITGVGAYAFQGFAALEGTLTIPSSVTRIGQMAFQYCESLTGLVLPEGLTEIESGAFYRCCALTGTLTIPGSVTSIGESAFYDCDQVQGALVIPEGVVSIGPNAFGGMSGLGSISLPESLKTIGESAFSSCHGVGGTLVIPAGVESVGEYAFSGMFYLRALSFAGAVPPVMPASAFPESLKVVRVPDEAYDAYAAAFEAALPNGVQLVRASENTEFEIVDGELKSYFGAGGEVVIPEGVTKIGESAFYGNGDITSVTFPESLETIEYAAFRNCTGLCGTLELPSGLTSIGQEAFRGCTGVSGELVIPNGVTEIGPTAFDSMSQVTSIVIGRGMERICADPGYYHSFRGMSGVWEITFRSVTPPQPYYGTALFAPMTALEKVYVPGNAMEAYQSAYGSLLPDGAVIEAIPSENGFVIADGVLQNYYGDSADVEIPAGVTEIGEFAFSHNTTLEHVTFPAGLTRIGSHAFEGCEALTGTLEIPAGVTSIDAGAFYSCTGLTGLSLPAELRHIGAEAFYNCSGLTGTLALPDALETIGSEAFYYCEALTGSLALPVSLTAIGSGAFWGCSGLTGKVTVPDGVTAIESMTFCGCSGITGVALPDTVRSIGNSAFSGCRQLAEINLPASLERIGDYALDECSALTGTAALGSNLTEIGERAFYGTNLSAFAVAEGNLAFCAPEGVLYDHDQTTLAQYPPQKQDTAYTIPDGVTTLAEYAFRGNTALQTVTIPDSVTTIGTAAFDDCRSLTDAALPAGLTEIADQTFSGCSSLQQASLPAGITRIGDNAFAHCSALRGDLVIPAGVTSIGTNAFYSCSGLSSLQLQEGLESIAGYAFAYCRGMKGTLVLPASLTELGRGAFSGCSGFTGALVIPDGVTYIESSAFRGMTGITGLELGSGVEQINADDYNDYYYHAFSGMTGVTKLTFRSSTPPTGDEGDNVLAPLTKLEKVYVPDASYDSYVEAYSGYLPEGAEILRLSEKSDFRIEDGVLKEYLGDGGLVEIPEGVTKIDTDVFRDNTAVTRVTFPSTLTTIGYRAFGGCTSLTGTLVIPDSVTTIGVYAFSGCTGLTGLTLGAGLTEIHNNAFYGCTSLTGELVIPDRVTTIGGSVFYGCSGFTGELKLGSGLTWIGSDAFNGCSGFTGTVVVPDGVESIESGVFCGMTGITSVVLGTGVRTLASDYRPVNHIYPPFYGSGVTTLTFLSETAPERTDTSESPFANMEALTAIYVPSNAYTAYKTAFRTCNVSDKIRTMSAFAIEDGVLTGYFGDGGDVVIPDTVTEIAAGAFRGAASVTSITIPESVTRIGDNAFCDCTYLSGTLTIPASVKTIGSYAFSGCGSLTELVLSEGVETIGEYAFQNCRALTGDLVIPKSVTDLGTGAFSGCRGFNGTLTLGGGLTEISDSAFSGCSGFIGSLVIPEGVTRVGESAFSGCLSFNGTLQLPETLTEIGDKAFRSVCDVTGELVLPEALATIGSEAFRGCYGITGTLVLPDGLELIPEGTFANMRGITAIVVGAGTREIAGGNGSDNAFYGMRGVKKITFKSETPPELFNGSGTFSTYVLPALKTIFVPDAQLEVYRSAYGNQLPNSVELRAVSDSSGFTIQDDVLTRYTGDGGDIVIPYGVTSIAADVFNNNETLTGVTFPSTLKTIGASAFRGCSNLTGQLVIPDSVTTISGNAFYGCDKLTGLTLGSGLTKIWQNAFRSCTGLTGDLVIPDGVTTIGDSAFYYCTGFDGTLTLPESLTTLSSNAFAECSGFTGALVIPENVTSIGSSAFYGCSGFDALVLPDGLKTIGGNAFSGCSGFTGDLVLPASVTSIGSSAFSGCSGFTGSLALPAGLQKVEESTFENCSGFNGTLTLPDGLTEIGRRAFSGCSGLSGTLTLPGTLTEFGTEAFSGCSGITGTLSIPNGVASISAEAFSGMSGVTSIVIGAGVEEIETNEGRNEDEEYFCTTPFDGMTAVRTVTFTGMTPPSLWCEVSPFYPMTSLERVIFPAEAFEAYEEAYGMYLPDGVLMLPDRSAAELKGLTADRVYSRTVSLVWNVEGDLAGYTVSRNGEQIADVTDCSFVDRGLEPGVNYVYTVRGYDAAGVETRPVSVEVTTAEPRVTDLQTENGRNIVGITNNTITAFVTDTGNLLPLGGEQTTGVLYYLRSGERVRIGEAQLGANGTYTVQWDVRDVEDGEYVLVFVLTDADGSSAEYSEAVTVNRSTPSAIEGVTAIPAETTIQLTWLIAVEADTTGYYVFRRAEGEDAFRRVEVIDSRSILSYTDEDVEKDSTYYYYVVGVNAFGASSPDYTIVGATLIDDTAAPTVTRLTPNNGAYLTGQIDVGLTAEDNVSVVRSALSYSLDGGETWTLIAEKPGSGCSDVLDTTALPDGEIRIRGVAWDAVGNESTPLVYTCFVDNTGPARVEGITWESTAVAVTLHWQDVPDNDIRSFLVEQLQPDGSYAAAAEVLTTLGVQLTGLAPDTSYTYRVVGYDRCGNRGVPSADVTVTTQADTTAPVITAIRPYPGSYNDAIPVTITAEDAYAVQRITLQVSDDGAFWTDVTEETYTGAEKTRTLSYTLPLADYAEGTIYVRGVAADFAGNVSDTGSSAPFVQHTVDRTAPAAPTGVRATGGSGYIEIAWEQGPEADLNTYTVWRADSADGTFIAVASGLQSLNTFDRNVEDGAAYWYYVTVKDRTGNVSAASDVVSAAAAADDEAPEIVSIYPEEGTALGAGLHAVSVLALDNRKLSRIELTYSVDGGAFETLKTWDGLSVYSTSVTAELPLERLTDGGTVSVRALAYDAAGHVSEARTASYTVDLTAPAVFNVLAAYDENEGGVALTWNSGAVSDLNGFRVYRAVAGSDSWTLVAQRAGEAGVTAYSCVDYSIALVPTTYRYRIEAVDLCGNTSSCTTQTVSVPDRTGPAASLDCESVMEVGVEYVFDASASTDNGTITSYHLDFGDGTESSEAKSVHLYAETGKYTLCLTLTDNDGNESVFYRDVQVKERSMVGQAKVHVVDAAGNPVPEASVYFDLGSDEQVMHITDSNGDTTFTGNVGRHVIGCVIANNEWLPAKKDVVITSGRTTELTMTLVEQTMIEGNFEITRMTFDEIKAAGIDPTLPENQHIVRIDAHVTYSNETFDDTLYYNPDLEAFCKAVAHIVNTIDGKPHKIIPSVVHWPEGYGDDPDPNPGGWGSYYANHPITLVYLDIPVEASFVKEFFDVKLHIINNAASEFSMYDNTITLNVPEGLSLVDTVGSAGSAVVTIPEIQGQTTQTINWILRGDEEGDYPISADYNGILGQFEAPIQAKFESDTPIHVYGLSALRVIVDVNSTIQYDGFYFNLSMQNTGGADMYLPSIGVVDDIIRSYRIKSNEAVGVESNPNVTLISKLLTNRSGYSQYIDKDQDITTLTPGMTLTQKYAVYNTSGYNDILYFVDASYEILRGYGCSVEVREQEMDLFSLDNALDKVRGIQESDEKSDCYDALTRDENFAYVRESLAQDGNFWKIASEEGYNVKQAITSLDFNYDEDEMRRQTNTIICELLKDESVQDVINVNIGSKEIALLEKVLSTTAAVLDDSGHMSDSEILLSYTKSGDSMRKLATKVFSADGSASDSLGERLLNVLGTTAISAAGRSVMDSFYHSSSYVSLFGSAISETCSSISDVLDHISTVAGALEDSLTLMNKLNQLAAVQEEAETLLDMLMENIDHEHPIYKELDDIKSEMKDTKAAMLKNFTTELTVATLQEAGMDGINAILKCIDVSYGTSLGATFALIKLILNGIDYAFNWGESVEDMHLLRVETMLSEALDDCVYKHGLNASSETEAMYTLRSLKYLVKMRMMGELSYVEMLKAKDESEHPKLLRKINDQLGTNYQSLDEYGSAVLADILRMRDMLFAGYVTTLDIPEAPTVSVNYLTNTTNESFTSDYEYSFDGVSWTRCSGKIPFEPDIVGRHLRVRVAESSTSFAGNIGTAIIAAKPRVLGDVTAEFNTAQVTVRGLEQGTYLCALTDSKDPQPELQQLQPDSEGVLVLPAEEKPVFFAVATPATERVPESVVRYIAIEDVTPEEAEIVSQPKSVTAQVGAKVLFHVEALGGGLSYQWQYSAAGSDSWARSTLPGSDTDTLQVTAKALRDGQRYRCVITDAAGNTTTSDAATLTVLQAALPKITAQPQDVTAALGTTVELHVEATGEGLTYQWQYSAPGSDAWSRSGLPGSDTDTLQVAVKASRDGQRYRCVVTGAAGTKVVSEAATLTVLKVRPIEITVQPQDVTAAIGQTVELHVEATGEGLTYQWQYSAPGSDTWSRSGLAGSDTDTLQIPVKASRDGQRYRCVVTDETGGTAISEPAALTVGTASTVEITQQPQQLVFGAPGTSVQVHVGATGEGLTYQWQYSLPGSDVWTRSAMTGNQTDTLTIPVKTSREGQRYRCVITDASGAAVTSEAATLVAHAQTTLTIVTQPESVTARTGQQIELHVEATGEELTYRWQYCKAGAESWSNSGMLGSTTDTLLIPVTAGRDGQRYRCVITDATGETLITEPATLTVANAAAA